MGRISGKFISLTIYVYFLTFNFLIINSLITRTFYLSSYG